MDVSKKQHWNNVYSSKDINLLGWYEEKAAPSLELLSKCQVNKDAVILDIGTGASTLIDSLIEAGFGNIIATDISEIALSKLKERLGKEKASLVKWIVDDITDPAHIQNLREVDVWHDRAVLHFLTRDDKRNAYLSTLKRVVKQGGYVLIAAFSLEGAKKCSGLDIRNYDERMLAEFLGKEFKLVEHLNYIYHMPSGEARPYIYTLFQRIPNK
ncbi:class I SAM-dependent methyltransferase [Chloroflexota bacterium]